MTTLLKVNTHLLPVRQSIWEARPQWRDIGRALDLTESTVQSIHEPNDGECLHQVLLKWMQSGDATIYNLLEALEDVAVGRTDIANEVRALEGKERLRVGLPPKNKCHQ